MDDDPQAWLVYIYKNGALSALGRGGHVPIHQYDFVGPTSVALFFSNFIIFGRDLRPKPPTMCCGGVSAGLNFCCGSCCVGGH